MIQQTASYIGVIGTNWNVGGDVYNFITYYIFTQFLPAVRFGFFHANLITCGKSFIYQREILANFI